MAAKSKKNKLKDQLVGLLDDIGDEGLLFLIRQANTLIYNQKVDELNRQAEEIQGSKKTGKQKDAGKESSGTKKAVSRSGYGISIEKGAFGTSYIMVLETARKTFGEHELIGLVKACHAASDKKDGSSRVYSWLKRFRDDVLLDAGISSPRHPAVPSIYETLKANFSVRE